MVRNVGVEVLVLCHGRVNTIRALRVRFNLGVVVAIFDAGRGFAFDRQRGHCRLVTTRAQPCGGWPLLVHTVGREIDPVCNSTGLPRAVSGIRMGARGHGISFTCERSNDKSVSYQQNLPAKLTVDFCRADEIASRGQRTLFYCYVRVAIAESPALVFSDINEREYHSSK